MVFLDQILVLIVCDTTVPSSSPSSVLLLPLLISPPLYYSPSIYHSITLSIPLYLFLTLSISPLSLSLSLSYTLSLSLYLSPTCSLSLSLSVFIGLFCDFTSIVQCVLVVCTLTEARIRYIYSSRKNNCQKI